MNKQMLNLDPFADDDNLANQNNSDLSDGIQDDNGFNGFDEDDEDDDMMLDGGMHLMDGKRKQTPIFAPSNMMQHIGPSTKGNGL